MIITLTTDFGLSDPFVGIMKGVILGIAPNVQIVDLTHEVRSYDIIEAAFLLNSSYRYFPEGTIHVVVVDPGVGSSRRALAASVHRQSFVAPDNGVLSLIFPPERTEIGPPVYDITNRSLFKEPVSHTFHGRDVFAPVAAHLARGTPIDSVGSRIIDYIKRPVPRPRVAGENRLVGTVLRIDKFGNVITNLRPDDLKQNFVIRVAGSDIHRLCGTFADAQPGELFAIEGSTGFIELALNQGSAAGRFNIELGAEIEVETGQSNN
jgi:S-adenosylmethionine hydrolase